jgi:hypothetical protein
MVGRMLGLDIWVVKMGCKLQREKGGRSPGLGTTTRLVGIIVKCTQQGPASKAQKRESKGTFVYRR